MLSNSRAKSHEVIIDSGAIMHCPEKTSRPMCGKVVSKVDPYRFRDPISNTTPDIHNRKVYPTHDVMKHQHLSPTTTVAEAGRSDSSVIDMVRPLDEKSRVHDQNHIYSRYEKDSTATAILGNGTPRAVAQVPVLYKAAKKSHLVSA